MSKSVSEKTKIQEVDLKENNIFEGIKGIYSK